MVDEEAYESNLTDLSDDSDDEYLTQQSQRAKAKKSRPGDNTNQAYQIQNALKVPRATTYTAQSLYEQIQQADIDLDPEYQRAVVWPESKQIGLIDSIFRNFYIPPVIFAVKTYDDGTETRTCIDGKQRLTSIHRFMSGHIPHRDPITKQTLWYQDVDSKPSKGARKKELLPEKYRTLFANKQVVCVEYNGIGEMDERDIFQRVQLGMALSPSEKLQVIATPKANFIRDLLVEKLDCDSSLVQQIKWDRARGNDFRFVAQSVFIMDKWRNGVGGVKVKPGGIPKGSESAGQMEKYLNDPQPYSEEFKKRILTAYDNWRTIAGNNKLRNLIMKCGEDGGDVKLAPIEFSTSAVLIERHQGSMTLEQLAQGIHDMRATVRNEYDDIRANARICKAMLGFISKLRSSGSSNGAGGAADQPTTSSRKRSRSSRGGTGSAPGGDDGDDNDEYNDGGQSRKRKQSRPSGPKANANPTKRMMVVPSTSLSTDKNKAKAVEKKEVDEDGDTEMLAPSISSNRNKETMMTLTTTVNDEDTPAPTSVPPTKNTPNRMSAIRAAKLKAQAQKEYYSSLQPPAPPQAQEGATTTPVPSASNGGGGGGGEAKLPNGFTPEIISQLLTNGPLPPGLSEVLRKTLDASGSNLNNEGGGGGSPSVQQQQDGVQSKSVEV